VTDDDRALLLYKAAITLADHRGSLVTIGETTLREYLGEGLIIHFTPNTGRLDVWYGARVLAIDLVDGLPKLARYVPGDWEQSLLSAALRGSVD